MSTLAAGSQPGASTEGSSPAVASFFDGIAGENGSTIKTESVPSSTPTVTTTPVVETGTAPVNQSAVAPVTTMPTTAAPPVIPTQNNISLTTEQLLEIARAGGAKTEPVVTEPTQEELDAKFQVVRPTEDDLGQIFRGGPEGVAKFTQLLHGAAQMGAMTASHHLIAQMQKMDKAFNDRLAGFQPIREQAQRAEMDKHVDTFFKTFNHWTPEHMPILQAVHKQLLSDKFNADGKLSAGQVYAKVNEDALALMRVANPNFGAAAAGTGTTPQGSGTPAPEAVKPTPPPSQMATLPTGGASSSGAAAGSSPAKKSGPAALFE